MSPTGSRRPPEPRELPRGTVTFLFTDIEGSTRLLQELGDGYAEALGEHRRLLRVAFQRHGGVEVDTQGDAFFVAFARASDALAAAEEGQRALEPGPARVRIGIHSGEPVVTEEGYVGLDVHRAARICATAHGGQVVLSESTHVLLGSDLPVEDLGLHRLKDLAEPVKLFQLGDGEFPPLRSLNATNLPTQPTPLVGRERELEELRKLTRSARLVTLTGAGGSGKTRLALQAAAELVDEFKDGVFWVSLAALTDPELVLPTIARTLGAKDDLARFVDEKRFLLLLDNLEQILGCADDLAGLLAASPNLVLLATSRAPLRIAGEQEYEVRPLPESDAIRLFVQRARRIVPEFAPDAHVPDICRRLDGLPLAVELAAARLKVLKPAQLLERLDQRLPLLTAGTHEAPERQRTLRATIDWSYELLDQDERALFARLAVFAGSFDLEAAEIVAAAEIDVLGALLDNSLLRQTFEGRFFMLATLREYAAERLAELPAASHVVSRHSEHYLEIALRAAPIGGAIAFEEALPVLASELENLRSARDTLRGRRAHENELKLATAMAPFFAIRGPISEGRAWLEAALTVTDVSGEALAEASMAAAHLARLEDDLAAATDYAETAQAAFEVAGSSERLAYAIRMRATIAAMAGDLTLAADLFHAALGRLTELGNRRGVGLVSADLADLALVSGDFSSAAELAEEAATVLDDGEHLPGLAGAHANAGAAYAELGDSARAVRHLELAIRAFEELGDQDGIGSCLDGLAASAAQEGDYGAAARLIGRADTLYAAAGVPRSGYELARRERLEDLIRAQLGAAGWARQRDEGSDLAIPGARALVARP